MPSSTPASKAAVEAVVLNLAVELGRRGITINAIAPGGVTTECPLPPRPATSRCRPRRDHVSLLDRRLSARGARTRAPAPPDGPGSRRPAGHHHQARAG
ncbi:SDR family oxidoreductase [Amycolatopsis sp. cmx-4-61]|uniref:SDR family oxidoreductase n=1 Tax=Amycolatopsis sp. cmx-4-61 TaxID=2790937 RepID=UPI00397DF7C2